MTLAGDRRVDPFRQAELDGIRLGFLVRAGALAAVAIYLPFETTLPPLTYYYPIISLAILLGGAPLLAARLGFDQPMIRYGLAVLEAAVVVVAVTVPNPFDPGEFLPLAARFKFDNIMYPLLFVGFYSLSFSPRLVLVSGGATTLFWLLAMTWAMAQPDYDQRFALPGGWTGSTPDQKTLYLADPYHLKPTTIAKQSLLILITSMIAAVAAARARRLVTQRVRAEQTRANLARYVSPNLVESLGAAELPFDATRRATVAIMFVDVIGFTRLAATQSPEAIIDLLRQLLGRLEAAVFRHGGTLDKYLGDGLMATFGTPLPGPHDAVSALACAREMVETVDHWRTERCAASLPPANIAIGLHWGPVVLGNIGGESRLEFATLGDSVNVASRIEEETRALQAVVALSDEFRRAVVAQAPAHEAERLLASFVPQPPRNLRGREAPTVIWVLPRTE